MADTIGSLIDKLAIVNIKIWHVQESAYEYAAMSEDDYAEASISETHAAWKKLANLNLERSVLITELDEALARAIDTGIVPVDARTKVV